MEKNKPKTHWILIAKLCLIIAAFSWVFYHSDTTKIFTYMRHVHPLAFIGAIVLLFVAQTISAFRNRFYFQTEGVQFNSIFAIGLYFTGMLFNTILPGGVGGDGYKIYAIGKYSGMSRLTALRLCLSDRASGMFAIMMLIAVFFPFTSFYPELPYHKPLLGLYILFTVFAYLTSIFFILKESPLIASKAFAYSLPIQFIGGALLISALLYGTDSFDFQITALCDYIVLFFISSIISVIPISIGGAGLRELSFLYGATYFTIDAELGIALAMLFFIVNILCSLSGLLFWNKLEYLYRK